jgi:hypothetical protein
MKTAATILLLLELVGCASAMPPTVKPLDTGLVTFPDDARVPAVNIYKANDPDTAWTLHTTISGSPGGTVTFPVDTAFKYYIAESTNSTIGIASQFSNVATNNSLKPVTLKIGK